jgi:integrase
VWSIRTKLQMADRKRDLALFNLAIDSKLRGCDIVALKVEDIAPHGYATERATVRQKKTSRPVRFEITEQTRQAVDDYLSVANRKRGELRRTKATLIYRRTGNLRAVQLLLGHTKIESTVRYLGIEVDDALAIAEQIDV